jgi:hypothetical protein
MVVVPARPATEPGGIGSMESTLGLLKSLKFGLGIKFMPDRPAEPGEKSRK